MASNQFENLAHANRERTEPNSLAGENMRQALQDQQILLQRAVIGRDLSHANHALETRGLLPAATISADRPSGDARRVHDGLSELHEWTGRSRHNIEKDLRDTVATLNSTQIAALDREYKALYGKGLKESLMAESKLSTETRQALGVYLKGADRRGSEDSLTLAEIGTRAGNLDMFEEAFRDANPEARQKFLASGGEARVKEAFAGIFSNADVRHAMDYVNGGRLSLQTQIRDNTGIFSSNREAIEHALSRMSPEQKAQYTRGEEAVKNGAHSAQDLADLTYYRQIHEALQSAGNKADLAKWDGEIKGTYNAPAAASKGNSEPTPAAPGDAREAFNSARDREYKSNDGIGRSIVRNIWDGTSDMSTDELNQYAADMARAAAANTTLTAERQQAHQQNLNHTLDLLKESKNGAADALVDGTLIVAGVGGAAFTGGASLTLLGAVGAGGAAVKIGTKAAIAGDDYSFSAGQVLSDGATGAVNAAVMLVGPAQVARVVGLGGKTLAAGERAAFSYGTEVALNSAAGAAGGAASGTVEGVTKWDGNKSFGENLARIGETAAVRGATGAVLAGVISGTIGAATRLARAEAPATMERPAIAERSPLSERPPTHGEPLDIDGRRLAETRARREIIESKFAPLSDSEGTALRAQVQREMQDVKAIGPDGKPTSAYESLMQDKNLSATQKETVLRNLGLVREHLASYRLGDRMHPDPEVNWIHTQGEIAKVLEAGRAKGLSANDLEDSLLASMYSDSVKFSAPAPEGTVPNFHTHHLDGALAADHSLRLQGFPQDRTERIIEAILAHQIAPPKFMGQLYYMKIAGTLDGMARSGKIGAQEADHMRAVLDGMTEVGPDGVKRIRQLANVADAPRTTGADGLQQVKFSPDEQKVFALSGTDRWVLPYEPAFDPRFKSLSAAEKEVQLSRKRIAQNLIDGDGADNYSTTGGVSKIVAIRGPETFFPDATVWNSIDSVNASFKDAYTVLTPQGQRIADQNLAALNRVTDRQNGSLKAYMDAWLKNSKGLDPARDHIPFYNQPLTYIKPGETPSPTQLSQMELAREIRTQVVDFMRRDHRTDNSLPGNFAPVRSSAR
ncbi:MAG: hypothetical protein JSS86_07160 [Cyanobacteria bacterium SZAS LIN-2]|nr:hypothetical protein [Cyanobacteria bacterium SZAS LIN-2]